MSVNRCFFDINIFVYSVDRSDPKKQEIAHTLIRFSLDNLNGGVSYRVLLGIPERFA